MQIYNNLIRHLRQQKNGMRQLNSYAASLLGLLFSLAIVFWVEDVLLRKLFTGLSVVFTLLVFSAFSEKAISNDTE